MDDSGWERWGAIAGLVAVALGVLTAILPGSPPSPSDADAEVLKFFADKEGALQVSAYLNGIGLVGFIMWFGVVRGRLGRAEGSPTPLATLGFGAGVAAGAMFGVSNAITAAMALQGDQPMDGRLAGVLYDITTTTIAFSGLAIAVAFIAYGALIIRTGAFTRWIGWVALADVVLWLVGGVAVASDSDAVLGLLFLSFGVALVVVLASSLMMLRGPAPAT